MTPESEQRDELVLKLITNHGRGMRAQRVADALGIAWAEATASLQRLSEAGRLEKKWRGTYGPKRAS